MKELIVPVLWLGGMALVFGVILGYASKVFAVEKDERVPLVVDALPGANCGGCGYPGCEALAEAIVSGKAKVDSCPVGGAPVADKVGDIMGVLTSEGELADKKVARVICKGTKDKCKEKFDYHGLNDCREAVIAMGGSKGCEYGCLGLGTCEKVCPFDAIHVTDEGIAAVDKDKCTACKLCIEACPKSVITLVPAAKSVHVDCNSKDRGKDVRANCSVGCIGCKICVKSCPEETIDFKDNLANINYENCTECMVCVEKCPTNAISADTILNKENVS